MAVAGWIAAATAWGSPAGGAPPVTVTVAALVEAPAADWPEIPADAPVDSRRLPARRRAFLEAAPGIPTGHPAVRAALREALAPLVPADRRRVAPVLDALGGWTAARVEAEPLAGCPAAWRSAARAIQDGRGHPFERLRVLVALARAAGVPAAPSFNGVPVALVWAAGEGGTGGWTVWDPLHPSGSFRRLPVGWRPLRASEVPLATVEPPSASCAAAEPRVLRYAGRAEAAAAWEAARSGADPAAPGGPPPLPAGADRWWEVWLFRTDVTPGPGGRATVTVPLPFDSARRYGTREHAVHVSDPAWLRGVDGPLAETDQRLGGVLLTLRVRLGPPREP